VPFILRTIRKGRWLLNKPSETQEERFARALNDLQLSEDNKLSIWYVEHDHSNLERLVTALGANRDHLDNVDYILLDDQWLLELGIQSERTEGNTPDQEVNQRWHYDLVEISADNHKALTKALLDQGQIGRILPKQLLRLIEQAIVSGHIDFDKLKPGMQKKFPIRRPNFPDSSCPGRD
jgi:hypothetical protein